LSFKAVDEFVFFNDGGPDGRNPITS